MDDKEMKKALLQHLMHVMDQQDVARNYRPEITEAADKVDAEMGTKVDLPEMGKDIEEDEQLEPENELEENEDEEKEPKSKAVLNLRRQLSYIKK